MKKIIFTIPENTTKIVIPKQQRARKVTEMKKWNYDNISLEQEKELIIKCKDQTSEDVEFLKQQIGHLLSDDERCGLYIFGQ